MYVEWTSHLKDPEQRRDFERSIHSAKPVLERLAVILTELEATLDRSEINIKVYDTPNWENRQAHKNGNRESLAYLRKLIDLDQQRTPNDRELT